MVIVSFPPNQDGFTPPQLMGIIRHQHIETPPGSVYPNPQVFPRAGTSYAQIMTSVDGNTTTAVFSPSGPPTAEEGLQMLHDLAAHAANARAAAEEQRLMLLGEAKRAEQERLFLLSRSEVASDQRDHLEKESARAEQERLALLAEMRSYREHMTAEAARTNARFDQLELQFRQVSPQATAPAATFQSPAPTDDFMQRLALAMHSVSANPTSNAQSNHADRESSQLAAFLRPYSTSHGPGVCPLIAQDVSQALVNANFVPYRWLTADKALATRIRTVLSEMATQLREPERFSKWVENNNIIMPYLDYQMWKEGPRQVSLEVTATCRVKDYSLLCLMGISRIPTADVSLLHEYAAGTTPVPNSVVGPRYASYNPSGNNNNSNNYRNQRQGRGGGNGGGGRRGGRTGIVQGGGDEPDLTLLNALVRA